MKQRPEKGAVSLVHLSLLYSSPEITASILFVSGGQSFAHLIHAVQAVGAFVKLKFVGGQNVFFSGIAHLHDQYVALCVAALVDHRVPVAIMTVVEQNHITGSDVGWGRRFYSGIDRLCVFF